MLVAGSKKLNIACCCLTSSSLPDLSLQQQSQHRHNSKSWQKRLKTVNLFWAAKGAAPEATMCSEKVSVLVKVEIHLEKLAAQKYSLNLIYKYWSWPCLCSIIFSFILFLYFSIFTICLLNYELRGKHLLQIFVLFHCCHCSLVRTTQLK